MLTQSNCMTCVVKSTTEQRYMATAVATSGRICTHPARLSAKLPLAHRLHMYLVMVEQATKRFPGGETTVTVLPTDLGKVFRRVIVIHRFDSGNFCKEKEQIVSEVAAKGLVHFYTS